MFIHYIFLNIHIHVHIYIYIYIHVHIYIYIYMYIFIYIYIHTCTFIYIYTCTYLYIYIHVHVLQPFSCQGNSKMFSQKSRVKGIRSFDHLKSWASASGASGCLTKDLPNSHHPHLSRYQVMPIPIWQDLQGMNLILELSSLDPHVMVQGPNSWKS